jgi:hypothetical protein
VQDATCKLSEASDADTAIICSASDIRVSSKAEEVERGTATDIVGADIAGGTKYIS